MAGRTIRITHKGATILVREGHDNTVVLEFDGHSEATDKKFPAAARYALSWLLKHGGEMRGNYERGTT